MRCERRENVLDRAVLVHVAGDAERGQFADFFRGRNRPAEDEDRQSPLIELANRPDELDATRVWQAEIENDKIDAREVGAHPDEQLRRALHGERRVPGTEKGGGKSIPHEGGVVGDDDGFCRGHGGGSHVKSYRSRAFAALGLVAEFIRFSL